MQSTETKKHFTQAINRIMTISMIHKKLYELGELSQLELKEYITSLIQKIKQLHDSTEQIEIKLSVNISELDLTSVVPVGLIINELIKNSMKQAFTALDKGKIEIKIDLADSKTIQFNYNDNGKRKKPTKQSFGEELLQLLTDQIDGNFKRNESSVCIKLPTKIND
ncbi:MAG: sensor histidine kinase [Crocinitomicaceae bacterium]|nr:sensor histidine kinase [Crocinitomicaceae bacterium]